MTEETIERLSQPKVVDWSVIKALWCADTPNPELAEEFGVTEDAIRAQASRNDWHELREVVRRKIDKTASQAVTGAVNLVQKWKEDTISQVAEAGLAASKGLNRTVKDAEGNYVAQTEAFASFETVTRTLKPFLGLNDAAQVNVGVQINAMTEVPEMGEFELPK